MIPEVIENGKNGFISNDESELRGFIDELLKNPELANKVGNEARKTVVERFSEKVFIDNWNNKFDEVMK
jgi:glycosyltransferase involved in cell wall biosynthesis